VLPTVSATNWMVSVCESLYPGYRFFAYDNYKLFKGIVFDGKQNDEVTMDVEETQYQHDAVSVSVKVWSTNPKGFRVNHYAAELSLVQKVPSVDVDARLAVDTGKAPIEQQSPYVDGTLFHGASFQGIKNIVLQDDKTLQLRCEAPVVGKLDQGQFAIGSTNPFVDDLYYQAMLVWVRRTSGKGSLPTSAVRCELYSNVPVDTEFYVTLEVVNSQATNMSANVTFHSAEGEVYSRLTGAEVTISEALNPLFLQNEVNNQRVKEKGKVGIA